MLLLIVVLFVWACGTVPDPASKVYYITETTATRMPSQICAFRYKVANSYGKLDNQSQQEAVRAAFDLWQKGNTNLLFLQKQDGLSPEIMIRFVEPAEIPQGTQKAPAGLIRGNILTISTIKNINNTYTILLDNSFPWSKHAITRALVFHIGRFLGLEISQESSSMMNALYLPEAIRLSGQDSVGALKLYSKPCSGICNNFLPLKLPVGKEITQSIRIEKPGIISIKASGNMRVGLWVGTSSPDGRPTGVGELSLEAYNLVVDFNHAALIYKLNSDGPWKLCGSSCEFNTDGISQCIDLTFNINDNKQEDNQGSYDITVDYKP